MSIKEIKAFEIGGKIYKTKEEAEVKHLSAVMTDIKENLFKSYCVTPNNAKSVAEAILRDFAKYAGWVKNIFNIK